MIRKVIQEREAYPDSSRSLLIITRYQIEVVSKVVEQARFENGRKGYGTAGEAFQQRKGTI